MDDLKKAYKMVFDDLLKVRMFRGHYDRVYGNEHFMHGICTVMEYISGKISKECGEQFQDEFLKNMGGDEK